jgi:hypothetical protein
VETIRRPTARVPRRPGASLLAAVVIAAGSALPSAAQTPDPSVSVLPPRPLPLPTLPVGTVQAGYSPFQRMPAGDPAAYAPPPGAQAAWLAAPADATGSGSTYNRAPGQAPYTGTANAYAGTQAVPGGASWQPSPVMAVPSPAPAWRWHGYGAVNAGEAVPQSLRAPQQQQQQQPAPPPPAESAQPMGSSVPAFPDPGPAWQTTPTAAPAYAAPPEPPPVESPLSWGEASWRPAGDRLAAAPANPMQTVNYTVAPAGAEPWTAPGGRFMTTNPIVAAPPGSYISRGVSEAPVQQAVARPAAAWPTAPAVRPVAYSYPHTAVPTVTALPPRPAPPPPAAPPRPAFGAAARPLEPAALRAGIERACAGRGRDVEVYARGPASLLVRVKVRQAADAKYVADRISELPELGPYQVLFEMRVAR